MSIHLSVVFFVKPCSGSGSPLPFLHQLLKAAFLSSELIPCLSALSSKIADFSQVQVVKTDGQGEKYITVNKKTEMHWKSVAGWNRILLVVIGDQLMNDLCSSIQKLLLNKENSKKSSQVSYCGVRTVFFQLLLTHGETSAENRKLNLLQ